jgi:predicted NBD/HSP70 family sugar kinase
MTRRIDSRRDERSNPADQRAVRRHNLSLVLRHIAERGPRSRSTVATETGLNKATVSSLVAELIERGLLSAAGTEYPGAVGRPAQSVRLRSDGALGLGLEVNVDYLSVCAKDLAGRVRHRRAIAFDNRASTPERSFVRLLRLARDALRDVAAQGLVPVGTIVAVPGLVDYASGRLLYAPNLGWTEVPVAELVEDRLGLAGVPVRVENEANLGALAELWEGAGRAYRDFIHVSGEVGVGAGIVLGGRLFRGARGLGGEFGHITIYPEGPICGCGGRGHLEAMAGQDALMRAAGVETSVAGERDASADLAKRAREGDRSVQVALRDAGRLLGIGLSSLANLFDPQAIILGGRFATLAPMMLEEIRAEMGERVIAARWSDCRMLVSELGGEAAVRGAASMAMERVLDDPTTVHVAGRAS